MVLRIKELLGIFHGTAESDVTDYNAYKSSMRDSADTLAVHELLFYLAFNYSITRGNPVNGSE